jgi:glycosyltransferase involved in cell wall biosynthesis
VKIMKVDLVMWTKNGSATLKQVLGRINRIIPEENVNQRFIVDDNSIDDTRLIASSNGWMVCKNKGTGISDGANTALGLVTTDYFCSFEQDLLLSSDWWSKIPSMLSGNVHVASGIRLTSKPQFLHRLQLYSATKYKMNKTDSSGFGFGKTLDNTIYDAAFLRRIGGFPKLKTSLSVDTALAYKMARAGAVWAVDYSVVSDHLRQSFIQELMKDYWYGTCNKAVREALGNRADSILQIFVRTLFSPIRAWQVAYKTKSIPIIAYYPLQRLVFFLGMMRSYSD